MNSRLIKKIAAGASMALLLGAGASLAAPDLNEVGAFLVYPVVRAQDDGAVNQETFITVTNTAQDAFNAHISVIDGVGAFAPGTTNDLISDPLECEEYDRTLLLTGYDTETLVLNENGTGIRLQTLDTVAKFNPVTGQVEAPFDFAVPVSAGFITVSLEEVPCANNNQCDTNPLGLTASDNVLMGHEIVVDYALGYAYSFDAIPFQGEGNNGDREYEFDGSEYRAFPEVVAAEFIAPDGASSPQPGLVTAEIALFTLAFDHGRRPSSLCSLTGFDADERPISGQVQFGCWGLFDLLDQPEFAYAELGNDDGSPDDHGWTFLSCRVIPTCADEIDPDECTDGPIVDGAVHGAIIQKAKDGAAIDRDGGPTFSGNAAWARLLWQSNTDGEDVTLFLEEATTGF